MGDTLGIHSHASHSTHPRLPRMHTDDLTEAILVHPGLRHGPTNSLGTAGHHGVRISHALQLVVTDSVHMRGLHRGRGKALTILTVRESRVPSLLREVVLVVHLGGGRVRRLRESGIRIGGILHHGHVVGLRRAGGKMLGVEHTIR